MRNGAVRRWVELMKLDDDGNEGPWCCLDRNLKMGDTSAALNERGFAMEMRVFVLGRALIG